MISLPRILMGYCTVDQVANLARKWTNNAQFVDYVAPSVTPLVVEVEGTNPTLSAVTDWIDNISAQFDLALGQHWFVAPVSSSAGAYNAISQYVAQVVADLVAEVVGQGRFATDAYTVRGASVQSTILREMNQWIADNADGMVAQGLQQLQVSSKKSSVRMMNLWKDSYGSNRP